MRRTLWAVLAATMVAVSAAAAPTHGFVDPPRRSAIAPRGELPVRGGLTSIAAVNANDANGYASLGEYTFVMIRGVVQVGTGALDPVDTTNPSNWFYVADATGAVAIAEDGLRSRIVAVGDSVEVFGPVFTRQLPPLRGTRTIDVGQFPGFATITTRASGLATTPSHSIPVDSLAASGAIFEGSLVRLSGLTVVSPPEWPTSGGSGFVRVTDGVTTVRMYVDDETNLDGLSPPGGSFDLTGFVSQDDPGPPFLVNHFVYPRSASDISQGDGSGVAAVTPTFVTEGASGISLAFTITGLAATLETIELDLPLSWTWATPGTMTLSGPGFASATASFAPQGGTYVITVTGAAITSTDSGTLTVGALGAPGSVESSTFPVRTAVLGGTPAPILASPVVEVVSGALPGDVLVNELYPRTSDLAQGVERSEFVEIRNMSGRDLVIGGWTLSDIGRTPTCTTDARWAFPTGTAIPSGGFIVVCQTALDAPNSAGFLLDFPSYPPGVPLLETYDPTAEPSTADDAGTPNMTLLDPSPANDQMQLLGGPNTNVGQCETQFVPGLLVPFAEMVVLRNALGEVVDVVEYRESGPCPQDLCTTTDVGGTGPNDAYAFGPPKIGHTLGRNAASTDTDVSAADIRPSSTPTPGLANVPGDTVPPVFTTPSANVAISGTLLDVRFDEPVVDALATDPAHYSVSTNTGSPAVREVLRDLSAPYVHYFLVTEALSAGTQASLTISGITDVPFDGAPGNAIDTTVVFSVPADAAAICAVQQFDESGFSPYAGRDVTIAGYVTIPQTQSDRISIWIQEPGEGGCGVNVFSFNLTHADVVTYGIQLNDLVQIHGRVTEFVSSTSGSGAVTEVSEVEGASFYRFLARGLPGAAPRVVTTGNANDEALEGTLLRTEGTVINSNALAAYIDDGSGSVQIFQNFSSIDLTRFTVGDRLQVTGVLTQFDATEPFFSGYELVPQTQEAIVRVDGGFTPGGPHLTVPKRVLVPRLGERMDIVATTPPRSDVIVEIYDATGRKVTTLYDGVGLGEMRFSWDGRGQDGEIVDPGVYLCHVRAVALDGGSVEKDTAPLIVGLRLEGGP